VTPYSDTTFRQAFASGDVQPASLDLHVGSKFCQPSHGTESVRLDDGETYPEYRMVNVFEDDGVLPIPPQSFVLAETEEEVTLMDHEVGYLWGRSSVGRLGLFVHNAGLVDPGFSGTLTLELFNAAPYQIDLPVGTPLVQMTVHELDSPADTAYGEKDDAKYHQQTGPTPSRLYEELDDEQTVKPSVETPVGVTDD